MFCCLRFYVLKFIFTIMTDNYAEHLSKYNSLKPQEDGQSKVSNFKLLYRNAKSPERDKSSGVSSDDENTSSSLVPIPNTLKQMRTELKNTVNDLTEHSEDASSKTRNGVLEKPTEKVMQSLEELRKKYTLLNESSVTWKVNSANLMLDDILNCTNFNMISNENCKELSFSARVAGESETETLNTEVSSCSKIGCIHFPNACPHTTSPLNFPSACHMHNRVFQHACDCYSSLEKGQSGPQRHSEDNQKGKSLGKKIQNLKGIRAVYQTFLKSKNPFNKNKDTEGGSQGIPGANRRNYAVIKNEPALCKCKVTNCLQGHYPKKMIFDLVESSETSNSDAKSTEKEEMQCTCKNQTCTCPEVIPKCICAEYTCQVAEQNSVSHPKGNFEMLNTPEKFKQGDGKNDSTLRQQNEEESSLLIQKGKDDPNKDKANSLRKTHPEWKKYCSKERKFIERTDIYYFDHGNSAYYRTTDNHPLRYTECLVERTDEYATKFWAEIFGFVGIGIAFLISFILQLYRFLFASILRSLTVGLLQIFSDYFFKPLLTVLFNGIIQPCLILAYNVATSFRDLCLPISQIFGFFAKEIANVFRACRLVEINRDRLPCNCGNKV